MDKVSPERKLCRITSSCRPGLENFQKIIDKFRIVKLSDPVPHWTLVLANGDNEESEKTEESSSSDEELFDFNNPTKNLNNEQVADTEIAKLEKPKEIVNEGAMRGRNHYNRRNRYRNRNNNRYYGRGHGRRNNINKSSMNYKGRSNKEEIYSHGSRDYNSRANKDFSSPGNQDFSSEAIQDLTPKPNRDRDIHSTYKRGFNFKHKHKFHSASKRDNLTADHHVNYNAEHYQHSVQHPADDALPSPWIHPPIFLPPYSLPSVSHALPENPRSGVGLLGDRPSYAPSLPTFQPNSQNDNYSHTQNSTFTPMASNFQSDAKSDNFICDQTSTYSSMASSNHSSFAHDQNAPYSLVASNYPSKTDKFSRDKNYWNNSYGNYSKSNQPRNKHYNENNNNQKQKSWNKNSGRHPNVRNNSSFEYRN